MAGAPADLHIGRSTHVGF